MRKLLTGLSLCVTLAVSADLFAQGPKENSRENLYEKDGVLSSGPHQTFAQQRIYERASQEARERDSRIEYRHWNGISMQRPTLYESTFLGGHLLYPIQPAYPVAHFYPYAVWVH